MFYFGIVIANFYYNENEIEFIIKEKSMLLKEILGVRNAAKYLEVSERTMHRLLEDENFPNPIRTEEMGTGENKKTIRIWNQKDLESFKGILKTRNKQIIKGRGRPLKNYSSE